MLVEFKKQEDEKALGMNSRGLERKISILHIRIHLCFEGKTSRIKMVSTWRTNIC
jgi:hypothetical protein